MVMVIIIYLSYAFKLENCYMQCAAIFAKMKKKTATNPNNT